MAILAILLLTYGPYRNVKWPLMPFLVKHMAIMKMIYDALLVNVMATKLTMWIYGLYMTVKWPLTPFYAKRMAIIRIAYHALLVRGDTV